MPNQNLHNAKRLKNDEFYTQLVDIEKELIHYKDHFKDKIIYSNCDTEESNFVKYFKDNFETLGLKDFVYTSSDFRSPENKIILAEADIVVTNPPFSLFREYVKQLMDYDKKFLIIGSYNAVTYKEIFPLIKDNKIWLGHGLVKEFLIAGGKTQKFGNITWYTNLSHKKRNEKLILYKPYNPEEYPKYDNYDAIEVSKVKDIPMDHAGIMGVPITFMDKFNPEQFEIVGFIRPILNKRNLYVRILIKRK